MIPNGDTTGRPYPVLFGIASVYRRGRESKYPVNVLQ